MSKVGIIFCGKCNSMMVDSGFSTKNISTLRCCECDNTEDFKVGKVEIPSDDEFNRLGEEAKRDACIQ